MSEQELREGLLAAVADEPPLAFDPDSLMARAEREVKRRRALFGAGMATAAVAVAAVAVPTIIGMPRGGGTPAGGPGWGSDGCATATASLRPRPAYPSAAPPGANVPPSGVNMPLSSGASAPPPGTTTPPPSMNHSYSDTASPPGLQTFSDTVSGPARPPTTSPAPPTPTAAPCPPSSPDLPPSAGLPPTGPLPPSGPVAPEDPMKNFAWPPAGAQAKTFTADQLRKRATVLQEYLKTRFPEVVKGATEVSVGPFSGEANGVITEGQTYLDGFTRYGLNGARSAVNIAIFAPGHPNGPTPKELCGAVNGGCKPISVDGGSATFVVMESPADPADPGQIMSVVQFRADGSVVRATGYNYDPVASVGPNYTKEIPIGIDQLMALATDSKIAI